MNILIADDEPPARGELRYILETLEPQAVFYEAANGEEALRVIERQPIEVLFLDINMPGVDGLTVAATIMDGPQPPVVVFATAYDEHALKAFELAALDYVVKPFDERRLAQTMERIRHSLNDKSALDQQLSTLRKYLQETASPSDFTKLWGLRENENRVLVDYTDVLYLMAEAKKVYVQTVSGDKLLVDHTLKELEPRLIAHNFVRVHKAYLVNLEHVAEVVPWFSGTYLIHMDDEAKTQVPMSRGYAAKLKKLTGLR
jgi:DNA-binding LytR/AlgR family response regulator